MKTIAPALRMFVTLGAATLMVSSASAVMVVWEGTNSVSATTNWSDGNNWGLSATPATHSTPQNNAANFNSGTTVSTLGPITINVDTGLAGQTGPVSGSPQCFGMFFGQTNGFHNVFIQPGVTWYGQAALGTPGPGFEVAPNNISQNSLTAGSTPSPAITYTNYTAVQGLGGTLVINGSGLRVEAASSAVNNHYSILDMSGLGSFVLTNSSGAASGFVLVSNVARSQGIIYLAKTNFITINNNFLVGLLGTSSNSLPIGVYLGQSNFISTGVNANTLVVGSAGCANGFMKFNPAVVGGPTVPTAVLTGNGGSQAVSICAANGGSVPGSAIVDLTGGNVTWSASTMTLGVGGAATVSANGVLTFDNGTVTANSVTVGNQTASAGGAGVGTINIGTNATFKANNTIALGTITGTLTAGTAGTINVNTNGTLLANTITNGGGSGTVNLTNANWGVALASTSVTNMAVTTFNAAGATNTINITSITPFLGGAFPVRFHLIAAATLTGASTLVLGPLPASFDPSHPYVGHLDTTTTPGLVDFVLTAGPASARILTWSGLNAGSPDGDWDLGSTAAWQTNSVATVYNQFDLVNFNDIASPAQTNLNLTTSLTPLSLTVSNVASLYTFGGGGDISGATGLTKQGTGTLILDNSTSNNFTGGVTISGGILQVGTNDTSGSLPAGPVVDNSVLAFDRTDNVAVGNVISGSGTVVSAGGGTLQLTAANTFTGIAMATNNSTLQGGVAGAFGASSGTVVIASGSTLDPAGVGTTRAIIVSGNGVGGQGAIVNSGGVLGDTTGGLTPTLTLAGDTTLSYPNRWDLGSSTGATLSTGGHPFNLTLNSSANLYYEWRDVRTDTNLANINVVSGRLGIAGSTTLGSPSSSLSIASGAAIEFFNDDGFNASINKQVVLNDNGLIQNGGGANTMNGGLLITNSGGAQFCEFIIGGTSLTVNSTVTGNGILLTESSTAPLILNGDASAFTGGAAIFSGTLTLNSTFGSGVTNQSGTVLSGHGTVNGLVDTFGSFLPGGASTVGTFTAAGGLTLESGASVTMDLTSSVATGGTNNDLIAVTGNVNANGNTIFINPVSGTLASGTYTLMTYTGSLIGSFSGAQLVSASRFNLTLNTNTPGVVQLVVTGNPNTLVWNNGSGDGTWNVQSSFDWTNLTTHVEDQFFTSDSVTFDDTISTAAFPTTSINIPVGQIVIPSVITNNSTTNYTISGPGVISGGASIVKLGTSKLTITTTNNFTGNVTIAGGTLKAGIAASLGGSAGTVFVTNGATLDIDASLTSKPLVLSGNGVGGLGALVNNDPSGTAIFSSPAGLLNITLAGNTTIGGTNRIDFGQNGSTGAVVNSGGSNFSLTVLGTSFRQWDNVAFDANFGSINVMTTNGGALGLLGLTTLGNPTNTLAVANGAIVELFNDNVSLIGMTVNKRLMLFNGSTLQNGGGTNFIISPVVLGVTNGDVCTFNIGGTSVTISNVVSGPANLVKTGSSTLALTATNTYTGNTTVSNGTLTLSGNGSISTSTNLSLAAATVIDVSGRTDQTLTLASPQTLQASGTIRGSLTANAGSLLTVGLSGTGTLTVTNAANLQGITAMGVGTGSNNLLSAQSINYGGTLSLSFTPGSLTATNTFKLFNATTYGGSFAAITPSSPGAGLAWDTSQLTVSGTLRITSATPPQIGGITVSGTSLTITGTGGTPSGGYHVWTTTNVTTRLTNWTVLGSGSFDGSGNFSFNGSINPADLQRFYIIVIP